MTIDDLTSNLTNVWEEIDFVYNGKPYWLSSCCAPEGKTLICTPTQRLIVDADIDIILDTTMVEGKPLREMLPLIE